MDSPYVSVPPLHLSDHVQAEYETLVSGTMAAASKTHRVGLILCGTGRQGLVHLGNLLASRRADLKYIVEADTKRWSAVRDQWALSTSVTFLLPNDLQQGLEDQSVQAVLVVTPTPTHQAIVLQSLAAGKDVFCEKPLAETEEGIRECYERAENGGQNLFCAFQRRFDPTFRDVWTRVRHGEVGRLQVLRSISRDSPLPPISYLKTSGGVFKDSLSHDIDMITWLAGELPTEVFVNSTNSFPEVAEIGDIDTSVTNLKFPSGALAIIEHCRYSPYGYDQRIEVFGRLGMLQGGNVKPHQAVMFRHAGREEPPSFQTFMSRYKEAYKAELEHFLDVVQGQANLEVTGKMVLAVAKVCEAAARSSNTGEKVFLKWKEDEVPAEYLN